mgnify:CR=1 FL=1
MINLSNWNKKINATLYIKLHFIIAENIQNYYIVVMNYFLYLKILPNKLPEFFLPISSLL